MTKSKLKATWFAGNERQIMGNLSKLERIMKRRTRVSENDNEKLEPQKKKRNKKEGREKIKENWTET